MRKNFAWVGTVVGLGGASLLSKANWVANHLGFLGLPDDVRGALIAMSYFPMLATASFLIVGIVCVVFLIHDYGLDRALLQWGRKITTPVDRRAPTLDDLLRRLTETERHFTYNLEGLQRELATLTRALRLRDAESRIKEADQVIMPSSKTGTAKTLLERYPL